MASTSETGHAKNAANFEELISHAVTFGASFNPFKQALKVVALQSQSETVRKAMLAVNTAFSAYKTAISDRTTAFSSLSKYVTRIMNALKASDSAVTLDKSAMSIVRKIHGGRASAKLTDEEKKALADTGKEVTEISSSQMSFDSRLENFNKFIKLLAGIQQYAPNEADLKLTGIEAVYNDLKTKNMAVVSAEARLASARIARDELMYKPLTGLVDIAADTKMYIKSVFGASSPQFRQVSKLVFIAKKGS